MRNPQFSIEKNNGNKNILFSIKGHLTSMNAIAFKKELLTAIESSENDCHIDLSGVKALDLTGVNALAVAHRKIQALGRELVILSSTVSPAEELLHLTKFIDVFSFQRA